MNDFTTKWAAYSLRFWGLVMTAVSLALPFLGQATGVNIDPVEVAKFSGTATEAINTFWSAIDLGMLAVGQVMTWRGAWVAKLPLRLSKHA